MANLLMRARQATGPTAHQKLHTVLRGCRPAAKLCLLSVALALLALPYTLSLTASAIGNIAVLSLVLPLVALLTLEPRRCGLWLRVLLARQRPNAKRRLSSSKKTILSAAPLPSRRRRLATQRAASTMPVAHPLRVLRHRPAATTGFPLVHQS